MKDKTVKKLAELRKHLRRGNVYRRNNLEKWPNSVDWHLARLVNDGTLQKLSQGLYYYPKKTVFGIVPPDEKVLVRSLLKNNKFLITSPNDYNRLGVGLTQFYNKRTVYNTKRHGEFEFGGRKFFFHIKPRFPKEVTQEFLLVDLVNNLDTLAEDTSLVLSKVQHKVRTLDMEKLRQNVKDYGSVKAKKLLLPMLNM
jgi:hypothetical protein